MSRSMHLFVVALAVAASAAAPARAQDPAAAISEARELLRQFEYERALDSLRAVFDTPAATAEQRIEAYEMRAVFLFLLGRREEARTAAERCLTLDPGHVFDDPSHGPPIMEFLSQVRTSFVPAAVVEVEVEAPGETLARQTTPIRMRIAAGAEGVARAVVFLQRPGDDTFRRTTLERHGDEFSGALPGVSIDGAEATLRYFVEAQAPSGHVLASAGTAGEPRTLRLVNPTAALPPPPPPPPVEPALPPTTGPAVEEETPWYGQWWVWTIVGAAVAGGVTAAIVVGTMPADLRGGSLGSETLR